MKITKVSASQFKGRTFEYKLGGVDVFVGDSFSGKTAVLDAVRVGLLGYHPALGKRPADTFALATGTQMQVIVDLESGNPIVHDWGVVRGTVRHLESDNFSDQPLIPSVLLDVREYFSMTGPARLKYVFDRSNVSEESCSPASVTAAIKGIKVDEPTEETEKAIMVAAASATELMNAMRDEDATLGQFLAALLTDYAAQLGSAKQMVQQMDGLVQGATQLRAQSGNGPVRSVEPELAAIEKNGHMLRASLQEAERLNQEAERAREKIERLKKLVGASSDQSAKISELERRITEFRNLAIDRLAVSKAQAEMLTFRSEHEKAKAEAARLRKEARDFEVELKDKMGLECCPFCKSNRTGWLEAVIKDFESRIKDRNKLADDYSKRSAELQERVEVAKKAHAAADRESLAVADKINERDKLQSELNALRRQEADGGIVRAELAVLEKQRLPFPAPGELIRLTSELEKNNSELDALRLRQKQFVASQQAELQNAQAIKQRAQHEAGALVFKEAVKTVREIQQRLVDRTITGLMAAARQFTDDILPGKLDYKDGDIGYWAGETWVTHEVFSGTETALAYAGLSVALAAEAKVKVVIIDELGIMDPTAKLAAIRRMAHLVDQGVIDNCLGADSNAHDWKTAGGITVHKIKGK